MNSRHVGAAEQATNLVVSAIGCELEVGGIIHQKRDGAKTNNEGEDVEVANKASRIKYALARGLGVFNGEEAH